MLIFKKAKSILSLILTPMISLFLAVMGNSLISTTLAIRLNIDGYSSFSIGSVSSMFFAGLVLGSFRSESFITRVGHIRAYSTFASSFAIVCLLQGLLVSPVAWLFLRFLAGFFTAGLFIIIESWFLASSSTTKKSKLLALYMTAKYAAQASGQFLLKYTDPTTILPFCIVTILACLSIIPLSMTYLKSPQVDEPIIVKLKDLFYFSPSGVLGCIGSGMIIGAINGFFPLTCLLLDFSFADIGYMMGLVILGAMLLQFPMGYISEFFDQRRFIKLIKVFIGLTSIFLLMSFHYAKSYSGILCVLFGGFCYVLQPICMSYTCCNINQKSIITAAQGLLLYFGLGAMSGPFACSFFVYILGYRGLFIFVVLIVILLLIISALVESRNIRDPRVKEQDFLAISQASPVPNTIESSIKD